MTHKAGIQLTDKQSGESSDHVVEFSDEEWAQLQAYLGHVRDLQATRFFEQGAEIQLKMSWKEGEGLTWRVATPPSDDVFAFLHRLRPLILEKKEPATFLKVRALLARKLKDAPIKPLMKFLLSLYQGKEMKKLIVMQSNNEIMNSEKMLFKWLNAHEYHRDYEKQEFLDTLHKILPLDWSRGVFLSLLVDKAKAISNLGLLVQIALGERDTFSVEL